MDDRGELGEVELGGRKTKARRGRGIVGFERGQYRLSVCPQCLYRSRRLAGAAGAHDQVQGLRGGPRGEELADQALAGVEAETAGESGQSGVIAM